MLYLQYLEWVQMTMKLYSWQRSCIKKWKENGYRGIVNVVTGAGKTAAGLSLMSLLSWDAYDFSDAMIGKIAGDTISA